MAAPPSGMKFGGKTIAVDVPHLAFVTAIAIWCAWFCFDAWRAQRDVENLILIVPGSITALVLCAIVAAGCFHGAQSPDDQGPDDHPAPSHQARGAGVKIAGTMAMLAAYAVCGPLIGFDVASFAYILAMLLFLGERRLPILLLAPTVFCAVVIYCFGTLLATPLPLLLFQADGS